MVHVGDRDLCWRCQRGDGLGRGRRFDIAHETANDRPQTESYLIVAVRCEVLMPFDYTVDTTETEARIRPSGEIDLAVADQLREAIIAALTGGTLRVVVDLTDVWFLDSSGIRALLVAHKFATEHKQTMTVENPTGAYTEPSRSAVSSIC